jgi:lambda family phage tail tape measure protein
MKTASGKRLSDLQEMLRVLETYQKKQVTSLVPATDDNKSAKVSSALGLKNNTAGTGFIEGLQAQIKKVDEGKYAMLSLQAAEKGVAKEAEPLIATLKKLDEGRSAKLYENTLERQNSDIEYQISLVGRTSQEVEILNVAHRNQLNLQQQIDQLTKTNGELSLETIKRMSLATEEATNKQISSIEARQNAERGWGVGTSKALNDYAYNASNAANNASTVFSNGFRNMEDAVANFAMTGQISFSSFANSVVSDLIRIQTRAAISGIAGSVGQYFGVGGYGSATEGSSNFIGPPAALANAKGNAFFGGKVTAFARGGVVSSPTMFPMANGAGLMGEAGPEAVMPLARDSSGRLGVRGGGSGGGNVTVNVVNQASNSNATATETTDSMGNRQIEILVASLVNKTIATGRADQSMKQAYNLRRVGK